MAQDYGLHISNFPYWFSRRDIAWCMTERFAYPSKVTPLWSGPSSAPYRRMSAFVHWSRHGPSPGEVSGWLPRIHANDRMEHPSVCTPYHTTCSTSCSSAAFRLNKMNGHIGSCRGSGIHNLVKSSKGRPTLVKLTCPCCSPSPTCSICVWFSLD